VEKNIALAAIGRTKISMLLENNNNVANGKWHFVRLGTCSCLGVKLDWAAICSARRLACVLRR
jgi:hypothetical protein